MNGGKAPTRRALLATLGATTLWLPAAVAAPDRPRDVGIGGTGFAPDETVSDRGIGGTGFVGTIQRFGSIFVNDRRIAYDPDVPVLVDGARARAADLRLGQFVRTTALPRGDGLVTTAINVESEVRREVEEFNAHVRRALYTPPVGPSGPPVITRQRDVDAEVEAWRERRTARIEAQRAARAAAPPEAPKRRWWRRDR